MRMPPIFAAGQCRRKIAAIMLRYPLTARTLDANVVRSILKYAIYVSLAAVIVISH